MVEPAEKERKTSLTVLRRRTVVGVLRAWREVAGTARMAIVGEVRPSVPREDVGDLRGQMRACLDSKGGEITERAHTAELGRTYLGLNQIGKSRFLKLLASEFGLDEARLQKAITAYQKAGGPADKVAKEFELRQALTTPRSIILRQFTALPDGFKFLVDMRADLLEIGAKEAALKGLENDLKAILSSWFDIGLLDLVEITWNSSAALLEKLMRYEAVHRIQSWEDLKNRLDADRRVYAFFHNKMPLEPLIFVQVAFVKGMASNIQALLDQSSPVLDIEEADTAIFYSISNAQKGLAGISFGNFLIKRVVDRLTREFKQIKTFATLSPIPGFRAWLDPKLKAGEESLLKPAEMQVLRAQGKKGNLAHALLTILDDDWVNEAKLRDALRPVLLRLCAHYLLNEKKNGKPLDPVAQFHLFNGARMERLNWLADVSPKGMKQSAGLMVNYYYKLADIDDNHEDYATEGKIVAARQVRNYV